MSPAFTFVEIAALEQPAVEKRWIWDGYLAPGSITLFTSMWKSGKTTLIAHLLAKRNAGGMLAGRAVAAGVSAVVTEEPRTQWNERHGRLGFGARDCICCRPFVGIPTQAQWRAFIEFLQEQRPARGFDLLIIDPLSRFMPAGAENHPQLLVDTLSPLQALTQLGVAILLVHHPRKSASACGALARGCGGLDAFADFLIEMYRVDPNNMEDRRRRLVGLSRDPATPPSLAIELNADGTDYTAIDAPADNDAFCENWLPLRIVLENAEQELTRQQIRKAWPASFPAPSRNTLWRWLKQAVQRGLVERTGEGTRMDPFRYYFAEKESQWQTPSTAGAEVDEVDAWMERWDKTYPRPKEWDENQDLEEEEGNPAA